MAELVPGYALIGLGFNGFSSYDENATKGMGRLFNPGTAGMDSWTNPVSGKVYTVPSNINVNPVEERESQTSVFDSRTELTEFFRAEAGVQGSYLSFSASLDASYESISKSLSEYVFGIANAFTSGYELSILEATRQHLAPELLEDPDYKDLPLTYAPENRAKFFRFFERFGTHFVASVQMGGRIYYESWIKKSYGYNKKAVDSNLKLEFKGVFKAKGSVDWNKVSENWVNSREVRIRATGGDEEILNILGAPAKGESFAPRYNKWVGSVGSRPAAVRFSLTGIEQIFSGAQHDAIREASKDYLSQTLRVQNQQNSATIQVNGRPAFDAVSKKYGVGYAIIDRSSLEVIRSGYYADQSSLDYNHLLSEVKKYENESVIFAFLFWNITHSNAFMIAFPAKLHDFLIGIGADEGLKKWTEPEASSPIGSSAISTYPFSYAVVGMLGARQGSALEDWDKNWPHASVDLEVFLKPESTPKGIVYLPE